jgi:ectoine hydroxylase-related dioxygenase (phytanoyl-CoA dioxygenase family)
MTSFDEAALLASIKTQGYALVENLISPEFAARAKAEILEAIRREDEYHGRSDHTDHGMVMSCHLYGGAFLELFDNRAVMAPFEAILGEGCIVYAYQSSSMPPQETNHSSRIHSDSRRIIPGYITNVGLTLLLDDFTEDNGGTWFLPGSQTQPDRPGRDFFFANSHRTVAPARSGFYFDANLWHAGGANHTDQWRHAITINMCRSWMKQRIDIPRQMANWGCNLDALSERAKQKLGFFAQPPASYDEYYAPLEKRAFRQKPD